MGETAILNESKIYGKKDMISTPIPMINVALSGEIDGGLTPGLTVLAGPSKHFKSAFSLIMGASYQKKYSDGVILFYDTEFGTPDTYFSTFGVDTERVIHTPITDIEQLKHDIMLQLDELKRGDKVCIIVDSIGNLASRKEVEDALDGKAVADMTRAKAIKSLFRMVTPHLTLKDIPMIAINHTYKEIGLYPKDIMSGGSGLMYSPDNVWIIGRQQDKDGTEIQGYHFIINVEKSRYVKEKSKVPITVSWEGGVNRWSGLFDLALEGGYIAKSGTGWYQMLDRETGELVGNKLRAKDIVDNDKIWTVLLDKTDLKNYIQNKYKIGGKGANEDSDDKSVEDSD